MAWYIGGALTAYLLGSIPFGLLVAKLLGVKDPRQHGSHNIGFTNVLRVGGKLLGILTLLGDIGKGILASGGALAMGFPWGWVLVVGFLVILGHIFSIFLRFQGGKGVATALGTVLGMEPIIGGILIIIWLGTVFLFRYSSGGALAAFLCFPVLASVIRQDLGLFVYAIGVMGLIVYCHKDNISRLWNGKEPKVNFSN